MREFKITEEQIKYLTRFGDARDHLIRMFPAAFEPEWEEVKLSEFELGSCGGTPVLNHKTIRGFPLEIRLFEPSCTRDQFKIEGGKIWRRKA